jgi:hypothetical protein
MLNADWLTSRACGPCLPGEPNSGVKLYRKSSSGSYSLYLPVEEPLSLLRILLGSCLSRFRRSYWTIASVTKMSNLFSGMWVLTSLLFHMVVSRRSGCNFSCSLFVWSEMRKGFESCAMPKCRLDYIENFTATARDIFLHFQLMLP